MLKSVKNKRRLWLGIRSARAHTDKINIMFFHGKRFEDHTVFPMHESHAIMSDSKFDHKKKTVLYIHGYVEAPSHQSIHVIVDAYLTRDDYNCLVLDWSELADGNFFVDAVPNIKQIGPKMAEVILDWFDEGLNPETFFIVGHSLGAQMSGIIGRSVYKKSRGETKIERISALDPAFPTFYPSLGTSPVNKNDAKFVDVIHTDAWLYGIPVSTGHADFWPNSGKTLQPGCPRRGMLLTLSDLDLCSHRRSWWFWADSVASSEKSAFHSAKAKSWDDFKKGRIDESSIVNMGIDCPPTARGDYYLQTNGLRPFSKGIDGLRYEKIKYDPNSLFMGQKTIRTKEALAK